MVSARKCKTNRSSVFQNSALTCAPRPAKTTHPRAPCNRSSASSLRFCAFESATVQCSCVSVVVCPCIALPVVCLSVCLPLSVLASVFASLRAALFVFPSLSRMVSVFLGLTRCDSVYPHDVCPCVSLLVSARLSTCRSGLLVSASVRLPIGLPILLLAYLAASSPASHCIGLKRQTALHGNLPSAQEHI